MLDIETIRKAVTKNRGGLKEASDGQIRIIWYALDETTQQKYLKSIGYKERKGKTDAAGS
ncbi:MAG: hypothetical protein GWN94_18265 [Phycisphaerae bacterium]|nr:hypothetical protein [Phycisphaerae bacterium]NIS53024.1 hypothetical protein [Phycisphaerae bacterium]NIX00496.1 hypothetical protein [Phycisphaerae bacterium]NIX29434.1 hypothetical protein [Phycisphaerae bacterium]